MARSNHIGVSPARTDERDLVEVRSAIAEMFGERSPLAIRYADLLATEGIEAGLLGPREAGRVWHRHILNCAVVAPLIPAGAHVVDLGSGAGLPGIPLAIARPDLTVVLLEPMQRRVNFLSGALATLGLLGVRVQRGRAQDGVSPLADVVVARAIAPLDALMRLSFGLLVDNGELLALKGAAAAGELEQVRRETVEAIDADLVRLPAPGQAATVIRVRRPSRPVRAQRSGRADAGSP